jgi:hypothetical protein
MPTPLFSVFFARLLETLARFLALPVDLHRVSSRVANNQSCLTELLDLIAVLQFNQAKLLSLKTASNLSSRAKID